MIAGRIQGDDFLDGDRLASRQVDLQLLSDASSFLDGASPHAELLASAEYLGPRRFGDLQMRLIRLH